jgi:hypothetical protein
MRSWRVVPVTKAARYRRTLALLICASVEVAAAANAKESAVTAVDETVETSIAGARAYKALPADFNADKASDEQLARYGLPPKPPASASAESIRLWFDAVELAKFRVVPTFQQTSVYHGPAKKVVKGTKPHAGLTPATSSNWSGLVVLDGTGVFDQKPTTVYGTYVVPTAQACGVNERGDYHSSNWIGIDGYFSDDVLQLGSETDINCTGGGGERVYSWFEWYPNPSTMESSFPVGPGDNIELIVQANNGQSSFLVTFGNWSRRQSWAVKMNPPGGTHLYGNSIEWIVERPEVNSALTTLTPYLQSVWTSMEATWGPVQTPKVYKPSAPATGEAFVVTMMSGTSWLSKPSLYSIATNDAAIFDRNPIP